MYKRWKIWMLAFCLLGIVLGGLESQRILSGWLRGEAFYRGRPTSYWRAELKRWHLAYEAFHAGNREDGSPIIHDRIIWVSEKGPYWYEWLLPAEPPPFLYNDPAALPVLEELTQDEKEDTLLKRVKQRIQLRSQEPE